MVEAAVALPFVLVLGLATADGGRAFYYREAVTNATRQALREAETENPTSGAAAAACTGIPIGSASLTSHIPWQAGDPTSMKNIANATALESSSDGTPVGSRINGATLQLSWHCLAGAAVTDTSKTSTKPSDSGSAAIEAKVSYNFQLLTPLVGTVFGSQTPPIRDDIWGRADY